MQGSDTGAKSLALIALGAVAILAMVFYFGAKNPRAFDSAGDAAVPTLPEVAPTAAAPTVSAPADLPAPPSEFIPTATEEPRLELPRCGDYRCDAAERCDTCPADCGCAAEEWCDAVGGACIPVAG